MTKVEAARATLMGWIPSGYSYTINNKTGEYDSPAMERFVRDLDALISSAKAEQREDIAFEVEARADKQIKRGAISYAQVFYDVAQAIREEKT